MVSSALLANPDGATEKFNAAGERIGTSNPLFLSGNRVWESGLGIGILSSWARGGKDQDPRDSAQGFGLHAAVHCGPHQRSALERLCRYITRPALGHKRLTRTQEGDVVLQLKTPCRAGITHVVMAPLEFLQRLAALQGLLNWSTVGTTVWPLSTFDHFVDALGQILAFVDVLTVPIHRK